MLCGLLFRFESHADEPIIHLLVPGFTVQELPIKISNVNGIRFAQDGRLTVLGYDGRVHLLSDSNGDGLEDKDELFWDKQTITVPVGMVWAPEGLYVASHGKVSLLKDTNNDAKGDTEEIIAQGWPPTDVATGGTDAVGITRDNEGNIYFGLLTADYSNPYRVWKDGKPHYETDGIRGTIQKWSLKTKKLETVCTGIRVPFALGFNRQGDLFNTDQEGATWCDNGNPLDEFNHIIPGRNYGFPPPHPQYLPNLISEPPVVTFGPQHQSSCGFVFNEGRAVLPRRPDLKDAQQRVFTEDGLFGPHWWQDDAFVAGESRGKIWRVKLAKTSAGYVGKEYTIARLSMLTTDVCISPRGELYVSCHSGLPDWGTGPQGEGKIFRISYKDTNAPQPLLVWAENQTQVRVVFDRSVDASITNGLAGTDIELGHYVSAADRLEKLKPGYQIVKQQEATPRGKLRIVSARLAEDKRTLILKTAPHPQTVNYALTLPNVKAAGATTPGAAVDLEYQLTGVQAIWRSKENSGAETWLPHLDSEENHVFLGNSGEHERFFKFASKPGTLELRTALALPAGTNILHLQNSGRFDANAGRTLLTAKKNSAGAFVADLQVPSGEEPVNLLIRFETGPESKPALHVSYSRSDDSTIRPIPFSFLRLPWSPPYQPPPPLLEEKTELAGGDYERGRELFFGDKLKCATCHRIRGEGKTIAPDLSNLVSRDPAAIRRDIKDPNAMINPDYVAFNVFLNHGDDLTGFIRAQNNDSLTVLGVDGKETVVSKNELKELRASTVSLMPAGLLDQLKEEEIRDLLVFLTSEPSKRNAAEIEAVLGKGRGSSNSKFEIQNSKFLVWVASKQDHGPGQHDYPAVQKMWIDQLNKASGISATNAWEWPSEEQFQKANALVFYYWNHDWNDGRLKQIDNFLARGGGIVLIHSATISTEPEKLAERFGLASQSGRSKYLHTPLDLKLVAPKENRLTANLPAQIHFLDEPYWPLIGDANKVTVFGTVTREGQDWPEVWTFEKGKGRVFGCIPGHYTWTHEDPLYRILVLRGIAWAAGEEPGRLETLASPATAAK